VFRMVEHISLKYGNKMNCVLILRDQGDAVSALEADGPALCDSYW